MNELAPTKQAQKSAEPTAPGHAFYEASFDASKNCIIASPCADRSQFKNTHPAESPHVCRSTIFSRMHRTVMKTNLNMISNTAKSWLKSHPEIDSLDALRQHRTVIEKLSRSLDTDFKTVWRVMNWHYRKWEAQGKVGSAPLPYDGRFKDDGDRVCEAAKRLGMKRELVEGTLVSKVA